jgi:hypothetical protein
MKLMEIEFKINYAFHLLECSCPQLREDSGVRCAKYF